ncbi:MAG: HNH endonuclease [Blastomonas fulva]|uniref:HNH endonuclease n=1 Tax=Blastomonas fulva TaxID=1550728 RepID=UPI0040342ED5
MRTSGTKWPYNTTAWRKLRALHLRLLPLCEDCLSIDRYVTATTVDHRTAISQGGAPFPSHDGLASYCTSCHSAKTARGAEAGAVKTWKPRKGCNPDGSPLDRRHPWHEKSLRAKHAKPSCYRNLELVRNSEIPEKGDANG